MRTAHYVITSLGDHRPGRARHDASRLEGDGGAALAELALVLPFLLTFVFGVIDVARVWQLQNRLANAAREGAHLAQHTPQFIAAGCNGGANVLARTGAEDPTLATTAVVVRNESTGAVLPGALCGTNPNVPVSGQRVSVTVSARFTWFSPVFTLVRGTDTSTLSGRTEVVVL